jgi:hypothetical protein
MTSPPQRIRVVCPGCGREYDDWWRPSVNLDLEHFDEEYLEQCRSACCPHCGHRVEFDVLVVENGVFRLGATPARTEIRARAAAIRLYGLAYACRIYAQFTDYDTAVERLREATGPAIDLEQATHRSALLKWLNAWGCRQFSIEHHVAAGRALRGWARRNLVLLPPPGQSLSKLSPDDVNRAAGAYERLRGVQAGLRRRGRREHAVTVGPTGAAKILYALRPDAFPPWDEPIRAALGFDGSIQSYAAFLRLAQDAIQAVISDAATHAISESEIPALIGRPAATLPKLVDEYFWVTITSRVSIPTPAEIREWRTWAER